MDDIDFDVLVLNLCISFCLLWINGRILFRREGISCRIATICLKVKPTRMIFIMKWMVGFGSVKMVVESMLDPAHC